MSQNRWRNNVAIGECVDHCFMIIVIFGGIVSFYVFLEDQEYNL